MCIQFQFALLWANNVHLICFALALSIQIHIISVHQALDLWTGFRVNTLMVNKMSDAIISIVLLSRGSGLCLLFGMLWGVPVGVVCEVTCFYFIARVLRTPQNFTSRRTLQMSVPPPKPLLFALHKPLDTPVYPSLVGCTSPVERVLPALSPASKLWVHSAVSRDEMWVTLSVKSEVLSLLCCV